MKQFTVKDFIKYNGPCFNCNNPINFRVGVSNYNADAVATLRPSFKNDHFSVDVQIKNSRSLQLWVFYKTNKIVTSDIKEFKSFVRDHSVYLKSYCDKCYCSIESKALEFDTDNLFIKPVGIARESLHVDTEKAIIHIESYDLDPNNSGTVATITSLEKKATAPPARINLPLIPLYKFQTKEKMLEKLKTYIVFS